MPWLIAMAVLIVLSGLFSASEAAYFYLQRKDLRILAAGNTAQRTAARLMDQPDRLLSAVLFWNLVINMIYFTISARVGIKLEAHEDGAGWGVLFAIGSLLLIIVFSEMFPKSFAVLRSRSYAGLVALPLALAVRVVDPLLPLLRFANLVLKRLFFPRMNPEPDLEVSDLERAVELSTEDAELDEHEYRMLRNIVHLSQLRADEWMRPRRQFVTFQAPVTFADMKGIFPPSGFVLVTKKDSEEIQYSMDAGDLLDMRPGQSQMGKRIVAVPWCASVADVYDKLRSTDRHVANVVNEHGETIGIITIDDIADAVFVETPSRTRRIIDEQPIRKIEHNVWQVMGLATIRRLAKQLNVELPETRNVTIQGVLQEVLQALPTQGDQCIWGPLQLEVLEAAERGRCRVKVQIIAEENTA
ncbi:MAG: hemolysin activation protein [Planctomycetaceae bacterium]|nr:hemolysin activation protein [Planctomycetaceae bacterium]